jgi:uncharacterized protein YbaP (TraB family)
MTRRRAAWLARAWRASWLIGAWALATAAAAQPAAAAAPACPPTVQAPTPAQAQAGMRAARDRGFLWRIRRDGRESYLYGTMHVAKADWMYPGPSVAAALAASSVLALELDLLDPQVQSRLGASLRPQPGAAPLPAALVRRLDAQWRTACLPAAMAASLVPEVQVALLSAMSGRREGLDPGYGIDPFLAGYARSSGLSVVSLETPELQAATLKGRDAGESLALVDEGLADLENARAPTLLGRMAQVWAQGRLDELERYAQWCECLRTPAQRALVKRLLDDRNPALAEGIDALHGTGGTVFAAVGALHMVGPLGLPALMAARGYAVERVEWPRESARTAPGS